MPDVAAGFVDAFRPSADVDVELVEKTEPVTFKKFCVRFQESEIQTIASMGCLWLQAQLQHLRV